MGESLFDVEDSVPATVGEAVSDERRFATGDARGLERAQPLNLLHPLVQCGGRTTPAQWDGGSIELTLPPDASPDLRRWRDGPAPWPSRWSITGASNRSSAWSQRPSSMARRSIRRSRVSCCGCRRVRPTASTGPAEAGHCSTMRWTRPCSSISGMSRSGSRSTSSGPSVSSNGSSTTRCSCAAASARASREKLRAAKERRDEVVGLDGPGPGRGRDPSPVGERRGARAADPGAGLEGRRGLPEMAKRIPRAPIPGAQVTRLFTVDVPDQRRRGRRRAEAPPHGRLASRPAVPHLPRRSPAARSRARGWR